MSDGNLHNGLLTPPPESMKSVAPSDKELLEIQRHLAMIEICHETDNSQEDLKTAPLISSAVKYSHHSSLVSQHAPLGLRTATYGPDSTDCEETISADSQALASNLIYSNISAPWSTFICGSQGSGKSHTLSCLLENYLLGSNSSARPPPLAGLVLHYDKFTGLETGHLCEAAYLCSSNIPVRVLVSPSNLDRMKSLYEKLPNLPANSPRPQVYPLYFKDEHLTISSMKNLMAMGSDGQTPLYMEVSQI